MRLFILPVLILLSTMLQASPPAGLGDRPQGSCDISFPKSVRLQELSDSLWFTCPCEVMRIEFTLYNRWGAVVLEGSSTDSPLRLSHPKQQGDRRKDRKQEVVLTPGVYYFQADYSVLVGDIETQHHREGAITVL